LRGIVNENTPDWVESVQWDNDSLAQKICQRLTALRIKHYGKRGKTAFAQDLQVPLTTYVHYESGRMPPVSLLIRAAQQTNVSLEWLIFGESKSPINGTVSALPSTDFSIPKHHSLIPLVGSTSAGLAHYWSEINSTIGENADGQLEQLLERCEARSAGSGESERSSSLGGNDHVALIQYSEPDSDGILEFLAAPSVKEKYPDALAWRIDGLSMSPRYEPGDLVVTSQSTALQSGHACVVRQRGQIGVNCKLFHVKGNTVTLEPANAEYRSQKIARDQIVWAHRIVSSVKLATTD